MPSQRGKSPTLGVKIDKVPSGDRSELRRETRPKLRLALGHGCMFSINRDAHSIRELDHMHWGVEMARKGGVPTDRVLNAMKLPELLRHFQKRRRTADRAA
jgi:hypothetical protein